MIKISIVCVGKIKGKFFRDAIDEYSKRLSRYTKLNIIEVADEMTPDGASTILEDQIREKEGARILAKLPQDALIVTLEIESLPPASFNAGTVITDVNCLALEPKIRSATFWSR